MGTKEKIEEELKITSDKIYGTLLLVHDFDDEKNMREVSKQLNIDKNTTRKLFYQMREYKKYGEKLNMLSNIAKHGFADVNMYPDVGKLEKKAKGREEELMNSINMAKYECLISKIDSKDVTKDVIEHLNENKVDESIRQKAIQKYASNINKNSKGYDEEFDFLYKNNYKACGNNSNIDSVYKFYAESRRKDESIKKLENEILKKEDEIDGKNNEIRALNMQVKYYEQAVPNIQHRIMECVKKAQRSFFSVKELQKQAEANERTGIFTRVFIKIKGFMRRDKPLLLSASLKGIQNEMSNLATGLTEVGDSIKKSESKEKIIDCLTRRRQLNFGLNKIVDPMKSR